MTYEELFTKPNVMEFFGNYKNMIAFLRLQAHLYQAGTSPYVSEVAIELEKCANAIEELAKGKDKE